MSTPRPQNTLNEQLELDRLCDLFEQAWQNGESPPLSDFLKHAPDGLADRLLAELWGIEAHYRKNTSGQSVGGAGLRELYPELALKLNDSHNTVLSDAHRASLGGPTDRGSLGEPTRIAELHIRCPHCSSPVELLADSPVDDVSCKSCGSTFSLVDDDGDEREARALEQLGRFELLARLGVGGFGTVWKARDSELQRIVAIKIPRKGNLSTREVEQFLREARAAAQLRHPNIVPVFEVVRERDMLFIVSEYVRGVPLSTFTREQRRGAHEIATLCAAVTDALECAHQAGIIHRDLKPSNVMVDFQGQPRLMDFGLAKREVGEVTMTVEGLILGTPAYMSPEQARGHGHWTDRRSDIYSLGVMLFHLLTGELPFRGTAHAQIQARLTSDPPNPRSLDRSIPQDMATIALKCMEGDPNRRYSRAKEVGDELRRFLEGYPIQARPTSRVTRAAKWARRNPALASALALGALLAVAGPTAAVIIAGQKYEIARRFAERDALVITRNQEVTSLQSEVAELRQQLAILTGTKSPVQVSEWQRDEISALLDERLKTYRIQLADINDPFARTRMQSMLAQLCESVDRYDESDELRTAAVESLSLVADREAKVLRATIATDLSASYLRREAIDEAKKWIAEARADLETVPDATGAQATQRIAATQLATALASDPSEKVKLLKELQRDRKNLRTQWPEEIGDLEPLARALLSR